MNDVVRPSSRACVSSRDISEAATRISEIGRFSIFAKSSRLFDPLLIAFCVVPAIARIESSKSENNRRLAAIGAIEKAAEIELLIADI